MDEHVVTAEPIEKMGGRIGYRFVCCTYSTTAIERGYDHVPEEAFVINYDGTFISEGQIDAVMDGRKVTDVE